MSAAPYSADLVFIEEDAARPAASPAGTGVPPWNVLIVDDDQDVHDATELALRGVEIQGRPLAFLHAHSGAEAKQVLRMAPDIAVVLLDVVMETPDSGLQLVGHIRKDLGLHDTRIILRTGQPGYAPEMSAIREYDINDYKTKSELTRHRLVTTLTAAIRSYEQIRAIEASRRGLALVVRSTPEILARQGLHDFARGVIEQLAALLGAPADGVVCVRGCADEQARGSTVLATSGAFAQADGRALDDVADEAVRTALARALDQRHSVVQAGATAVFLGRHADLDAAVALAGDRGPATADLHLLDVFGNNVAVCLDNVRLLEQLRTFAYGDLLVGLPNRLGLIGELDRRRAAGDRDHLTLALADIDRFAEINDAFGHEFGDSLLKGFARQLTQRLDPSCFVARIGNDVFAVLGSHDHVNPHRVREAIGAGIRMQDQVQPVSVTLGLLRLAEGTGDGADLLKDANIALKQAKQTNRGHECYYRPDMGAEIRERVRLLDDLRRAIDRERLFVVYQPQIDLATGRPVGAEALLRWRNDEGRFVPPERFIPLAEYSGLIIGLGGWVLRNACRFQRRLHDAGFTGFRIAVNLSVAQFRDPHLLERIGEAVRDAGIDPHCLELEITESVAMTGEAKMVETFAMLRTLGIQLAIDDFGTGYSSLAYLQRLRVDRLKIDRSFTHELGAGGSGSIADMVVQLGRTLKLTIIAEGVEDERQADVLRGLGCHEAQGYLYARPMPADELTAWLQARRS
jgi:diguanylate cyclase (GGDEF)-like protein